MKKLFLYTLLILASTQIWAAASGSSVARDKTEDTGTPDWDVTIYPNPNNGVFSIMIVDNHGAIEVVVFNVIGEKVFELTTLGDHGAKIDLSSLEKGLYFIQCMDRDGGEMLTRRMYIK
ncbi:MAG: T9SS type A sorting domain-containing protein [Flavobacteriales bacterium]|jgi:hypothetical protein|nr:T9SS type A sorting domain-containing protein [Flavobacteriales bacterium]